TGVQTCALPLYDARIDLEGSQEYPGAGLNVRFALQKDLNALLERNRAEPVQPSVAIVAVLFRYVGEGLMRFEDCWREFPQLRRWLKKVEPWMRNLDLSSEDRCIEQAFEIYDALRSKSQPQAGNEIGRAHV